MRSKLGARENCQRRRETCSFVSRRLFGKYRRNRREPTFFAFSQVQNLPLSPTTTVYAAIASCTILLDMADSQLVCSILDEMTSSMASVRESMQSLNQK